MTHNKLKTSRWLDYGSVTAELHWETCPTCQGSGRIRRSEEAQLVAVIPCSDKRLKPSRTKLYVCISVALCLLICFLILFFLFPRSLVLTPNKLNISNQNFVSTHAHDLDLQILFNEIVVGTTKVENVTTVLPRSQKSINVVTSVIIEDEGLVYYCQPSFLRPHTLYMQLQITVKAYYMSHEEQLSLDTFEFIDCGKNTTIPHPIQQFH